MKPAARTIASKIKWSPPGRLLWTSAGSAADFARGFRCARRLPPATDAAPRFSGEIASNPLEAYFDDHIEGPGLWKWRHYFGAYDRHLARFRGEPVRMLEVGVFGGGSLGMWRAYLGPDSQLYGVDINPTSREHASGGIEIIIGDQGDPRFWADLLTRMPPLDIVLDDGGHQPFQQIVTFEALLPHMRPGGVYICEDIHAPFNRFHSYIDGFTRGLHAISPPTEQPAPASALHAHVASVHHYPLLTVIEKPAAPVTAFEAPRRGTEWPREKPRSVAPDKQAR